MYSQISHLFLALGVALTLGACESLPDVYGGSPESARDRVEQIHPGLTQDEVRRVAGVPGNVTGDRSGETVWIYPFTDDWGYRSEFDVTFGANGRVTDTYSERLDY
jgi:outer membrane protein assembly factor BamE (lipoprotein component of BamABCDE complex)